MNLPPLDMELTLTQKFELTRIKNDINKLSRDELETLFIDVITQKYFIQNALRNVLTSNGVSDEQSI
jgi:hypothetical protein